MRGEMEESVTLREFRRDGEDVDAMMEWAMDEKMTEKYTSWEAYKSRESVEEYLYNEVINHPFYMAVCADAGRPVGAVLLTMNKNDSGRRIAEIGYHIGSKWWGRGIATEGVRKAVRIAFQKMESLQRIEALVEPSNVASHRVLEKAGFGKEGLLRSYVFMRGTVRDMFIYSFLRSDLPCVSL